MLKNLEALRLGDMGRTAYLRCRGCEFTTEISGDGRKCVFVFRERAQALRYLLDLPANPDIGANDFLTSLQAVRLALREARRATVPTDGA